MGEKIHSTYLNIFANSFRETTKSIILSNEGKTIGINAPPNAMHIKCRVCVLYVLSVYCVPPAVASFIFLMYRATILPHHSREEPVVLL